MTGLMVKDLRILLKNKQNLLLFVIIAVVISFTADSSFIIGYLTFVSVVLAISTISYDEFDNGYPFLMTLPITRRAYVTGKYILCIFAILIAWILALALCFVSDMILGNPVLVKDTLMMAVVMIPLPALAMSVMLPLQLKYGAERSRLVIFAVAGIGAIVGYGILKLSETAGLDFGRLMERLSGIPDAVACLILIGIGIVATLISMAASNAIMKKKEF